MDGNQIEANHLSGINLENFCRTCGNSSSELISIFDDEGLGYELNNLIASYLHVHVRSSVSN